ncbi:hypothetical protein [Nocardioides jensenii]|uniref:hypothetical protein n=1 Tax=Nocardioides jensenii TaxID=1843 RepID=UPI000836E67B|nr:hypothetical protein [Nocardioides jensenii]
MKPGKTVTSLAVLGATLLLSASSCGDDAVRVSSQLARGSSDDALRVGALRAEGLLANVSRAARPTIGQRLKQDVRTLSEDPQVQTALEGLAWDTTCALVGGPPESLDQVASFLLERAAGFGLAFFDEGEQKMAGLVLDAITEQESEAEQACDQIS